MSESRTATGGPLAEIEHRLRAGPGLSVSSDLTVTVDGTALSVSSFTDLLRVELPSLRAALALVRRESGRLGRVASLLDAAGLTAAVVVGRSRIATVGADATPGPLAARLGLGPVRLHARGVGTAVLRAP